MLSQILMLTLIVFGTYGCGEETNSGIDTKTTTVSVSQKDSRVENALDFINAYNDNSSKLNKAVGTIEWVNANALTTREFKAALGKLIHEAYAIDPEMGLGADPIFDAQDSPTQGFELEYFDEKTNYLIVKGKDWPEFRLSMKVIEENGEWLVDGCGMVNIPNHRRIER